MEWVYRERVKPEWTRWLAWWPTPIGEYPLKDGQKIVWLKWIERKWLDNAYGSPRYAYREIPR